MGALKVLVSGDVAGDFDKLLKRVVAVNKKAGPFDMLLCVGRFLSLTKASFDMEALRSGSHCFPISTYVVASADDTLLGESGGEICPNLTNLGSMGVFKTGAGLRLAYCGRTSNESEVKSFLSSSLEANEDGVDVLLTSEWPENVMEFSMDPDKCSRVDAKRCSRVVSIVARALRPRYHFAATQSVYYERLPFRNHQVLVEPERHVTRFFGLSQCGDAKEKWLYAFNIVPMSSLSKKELRTQPPDVTESPFRDSSKYGVDLLARDSRERKESGDVKQYFYDFGGRQAIDSRGGRQRGRGSERSGTLNRRGHGGSEDGDNRPEKQPRSSCWFCLSSPDVVKHLIVSVGEQVYLALPKGGLVSGHVLILPVEHTRALYAKEGLDDLLEEAETLKTALKRYFRSQGLECVFYERNYRSNHSQLHAVPIPAASQGSCCEEILSRIRNSDVGSFKVLPKFADLKQIGGDGSSYLYVELPDGRRVFGKLPFPQRGVDDRHIVNFMSAVLADVLDVQDRLDWRKCVESEADETAKRDAFVKSFSPFDPFGK